MSTQLLTILQLCVLALIYLFFVRVLRSVWTEVHAPAVAEAAAVKQRRGSARRRARQPVAAGVAADSSSPRVAVPASPTAVPTQLVIVEPAAQQGTVIPLTTAAAGGSGEVVLGRSGACTFRLDDTYASSAHARVIARSDGAWVDDLGSTNGTYVNSHRVSGSVPLQRGDLIQVGSTVMEVR